MNKTVITERLIEAIRTCENALRLQDDPFIAENGERIRSNLREIDGAHCKSWIGYHACVYYKGFGSPRPGDHFSSEWGFMGAFSKPTSQNWVEYAPEAVEEAAMSGVHPDYRVRFTAISRRVQDTFSEAHDTVLTIADILLDKERTSTLERLRDGVNGIEGQVSPDKVIKAMMPGCFMSRDSAAMSQGIRCPPHAALSADHISQESAFTALISLVKSSKSLLKYMEIHDMTDQSTAKKTGKVFIGHGRSAVWRDLKDFLQDRLKISWEEFNREPTAGIATTARLQQVLDDAGFAFLIMTAEDEHADESIHARENVIHEVGLFQGRLGFPKAIVLLEDGCSEFSNIAGLGQIRFPAGDISAKFEELRRVLEREGVV